ncbi:hypothetical protein AB0C51_08925 [Streptomyces pathocidini]|uniref:Uncharacterized protein n=1 Tax=Streptomyces pathocidini TaxID=1650571 RepID=A0ABW7URH2_9ACTN|nr:hypothetical protein [Streptomyces pathocidini]
MAALAWLLIPVVAAVVAAVWARWAARHRKVGDVAELAGYERFREAMERSSANPEPAPAGTAPAPDSDAAA